MGIKYLWDTNTAIYYLQQLFPPGAEKFMDDLLKDEQPVISAITEISAAVGIELNKSTYPGGRRCVL